MATREDEEGEGERKKKERRKKLVSLLVRLTQCGCECSLKECRFMGFRSIVCRLLNGI